MINKKGMVNFIDYMNDLEKENEDRYNKISPWMGIYTRYLQFEKRFKPTKLKNYEKGDIIRANFGFNIGNELGGVHFAMVLENNNDNNSGTVTVIPLSSIKDDEKAIDNKFVHYLNCSIYELMLNKINIMSENFTKEINQVSSEGTEIEVKIRILLAKKEFWDKKLENLLSQKNTEEINEIQNKIEVIREEAGIFTNRLLDMKERIAKLSNNNEQLKTLRKEIHYLKQGSKAFIGQITTISKLRIISPKKTEDALSDIKVSDYDLNEIQKIIKNLFIKNIDIK